MADTENETPAQSARAKRRLRAPSESVREKAAKAQVAAASPKKRGPISQMFYGFTMPLRWLWRGLAWTTHRPPLKQIGHGLRWFFTRKPMRFLGKILGFNYVASSFREVKLVTWPTMRQSFRLTGAVIIFSAVFGTLIFVVDLGLDKLFKQIILK